ncbi:MAG: MerR family transcriptional regulator [Chloroflexi bacterium]|nr:MerR family transcriptional regulator [Chloroflexota bacterium]
MFKIGEFAQLAGISVRMLHHYDQLGLLRPRYVDRQTGYRYYAAEQLNRLHRILALKDLGLTLDEVAYLLDEAVTVEALRGMLLLKRAELHRRVQEEQARLARVEARLQHLEKAAGSAEYDIVIKSTGALDVVVLRRALAIGQSPAVLFREGLALLRERGLEPSGFLCLYYFAYIRQQHPAIKPRRNLIEAAFQVDLNAFRQKFGTNDRRLRLKTLNGFPLVASAIHCGPDQTRHLAFQGVRQWMAQHHYCMAAPAREFYLRRDPAQHHITEVQIPLQKIQTDEA